MQYKKNGWIFRWNIKISERRISERFAVLHHDLKNVWNKTCFFYKVINTGFLQLVQKFRSFSACFFAVNRADWYSVCCRAGNHYFVSVKKFLQCKRPLFKRNVKLPAYLQEMSAGSSWQNQVIQWRRNENSIFQNIYIVVGTFCNSLATMKNNFVAALFLRFLACKNGRQQINRFYVTVEKSCIFFCNDFPWFS